MVNEELEAEGMCIWLRRALTLITREASCLLMRARRAVAQRREGRTGGITMTRCRVYAV
jgi:hypothetical protein